jgi:hypothetical protein
MPKQRVCKKITIIILVIVFVFSPLRFPNLKQQQQKASADISPTVETDTTWGPGELLVDKWVTVKNGATLTIAKGTTLIFAGEDYESAGIKVANGAIFAEGTESEKIVFKGLNGDSTYGMYLYDKSGNKLSFFRYVEFIGGGHVEYPVAFKNNSYMQKVLAYGFLHPTVIYYDGKVHIENSTFRGSIHKDIIVQKNIETESDTNYLEISNSNFEEGRDETAIKSNIYCYSDDECPDKNEKIRLVNNWYGDELGPKQFPEFIYGGKRVEGDYMLPNWRSKKLIADPVVVIPGIMGSATKHIGDTGELKMDPILHTYDNMLLSFEENGYEKNVNLFEFPYEWRNSNIYTAGLLKDKIKKIKNQTGVFKIDIAAHSMGGLVSRYYIESPLYRNDVDQLITMGTPQKGAPGSYLSWEGGETIPSLEGWSIKFIFGIESHVFGDMNFYDYIRGYIKSSQELLPDYDYLRDANTENMRDIPENTFLDFLNDFDNVSKLDPVRFIAIVGDVQNYENTISGFRVVDSEKPGIWEHGMPENYYDDKTDHGIEKGHGDETVPLESAMGINADETKTYDSTHGDLPTKSQCYVIEKLSGITNCNPVNSIERVTHVLTFGIFSPVDIQVVETNTGKRIGKDFQTGEILSEIPGAFYSGYETENEYITIPNPEDGEYQILTQGTDNGAYKIEATKISESEDGSASESTVSIEGIAQKGINGEPLKVEVQGSEVIAEETKDTVAPIIEITNPEEKAYINNQTIDLTYEVTDNLSEREDMSIQTKLDNQEITESKIDLLMLNLGNHTIKITATDKANNTQEKEITFSTLTNIQATQDNIKIYYEKRLIKSKQQKSTLLVSLEVIKQRLEFLHMIQNNPHISKKAKETIKKIVREQIENHIEFLIRQINHKQKYYDTKVKALLIEDLQWLELNAVK